MQGTSDTLDDLAIASIGEAFLISPHVIKSTGSVLTYAGEFLSHLTPPQDFELKPAVLQDTNEMGILAMAIGDVRGTSASPATNLLFVPSHYRNQVCATGNVPTGAVDVFDLQLNPPLQISINPPELTGLESGTCNVREFGHGLDLGDVDGDGVMDLVVGAHGAYENGDRDQSNGRLYIFFGHAHFLDLHYPTSSDPPGYLYRCAVVKAPLTISSSVEPFPDNGTMGVSVAVGDLDNDGLAEVLTGRHERHSPPSQFAPGRAHLFWGSYLTAHAPSSSGGHTVIVPPEAEDATSAITFEGSQPAYQTLYDPAGHDGDWFGWMVYIFDYDLGGPGYGTSSWRRDIAVHGENSYGWQDNDFVVGQGCLSVYFGNSGEAEDSLADTYAVRLQVPANSGELQQADRFGRMAVDMPWRDINGSPITTLWVDAPDHTFSEDRSLAGAIFCFKAPLDVEGGMDNAWGTFVLKEVADSVAEKAASTPGELIDDESDMDPQGTSHFGAMMIRLRYSDEFVGDQIAISARERALGNGVSGIGQVYTFYLDDN